MAQIVLNPVAPGHFQAGHMEPMKDPYAQVRATWGRSLSLYAPEDFPAKSKPGRGECSMSGCHNYPAITMEGPTKRAYCAKCVRCCLTSVRPVQVKVT